MSALQEKPQKPKKEAKRRTNEARRPPGAPTRGGSAMGGRSMTEPHWQNARGPASRPPGQGTPCRVPGSPRSATLLDVSLSLEGQTTFKSDEIRTITSVSKRASQR